MKYKYYVMCEYADGYDHLEHTVVCITNNASCALQIKDELEEGKCEEECLYYSVEVDFSISI